MVIKIFPLLIILAVSTLYGQPDINWEREQPTAKTALHLFHSKQVVNFPTSETLKSGEFEYEISHRFLPAIDGENVMFGIDGPAHIRMALAYAITDRMMINLGRSNASDNIDLRVKYRLWEKDHSLLPLSVAARAGGAWSTEVINRDKSDSKNIQYYGQAIFNTLIKKKVGIGVVPSYLYNSHIYCQETQDSFTLGSYIQVYLTSMLSIYAETNTTISGWRQYHNPVSLGIELETGGHFFKIFVGNSSHLNPSQYLAGADKKFGSYTRLGFNITRILTF
ncbi:MAG: hypothetical protein GF313_10790 [Caldithrix sp.]|nr:hypothetical protein [Caldithrix sp.]